MPSGPIQLPLDDAPKPTRSRRTWTIGALVLIGLLLLILPPRTWKDARDFENHDDPSLCQQAVPVWPSTIDSGTIRERKGDIIEALSGAVSDESEPTNTQIQIPTQTFDDMGEFGEDRRWDGIVELHKCKLLFGSC